MLQDLRFGFSMLSLLVSLRGCLVSVGASHSSIFVLSPKLKEFGAQGH